MIAALTEALRNSRHIEAHRPWPRVVVEENIWRDIATQLGDDLTLAGFWGEAQAVHMALLDRTSPEAIVVSLECTSRRFPSVAQFHAPAIRLERTIHDLFGLIPEASPDTRPWLDHGRWGTRYPLSHRPIDSETPQAYEFLPSDGESLHQIPVGPVHAGIIEPGHFRFTANGETVVRLEERLGYVHKGIEPLMAGAELTRAAQLAGRTSGDSTVAYALAFARAAEAALQIAAPPRAIWLRALMAELERLANHFGDIGAICNDASFSLIHAHCGVLRERVLRACDSCFGHRLMRDCVVPGGASVDLDGSGVAVLHALLKELRERFPAIVEVYDNTASLQDRTVGTGIVKTELVYQFGAGGFVGRASGRKFDARQALGYPPYDVLHFEVPVLEQGDVNARVWIRIREIEQSLWLVEQILSQLPHGALRVEMPRRGGEAMSIVEGFRGDILVWMRLDDTGRVARCHLRDPSWFQWPLLEAAIEGNIVADFPICNKSFNCSYSGHDL
jgi:Ni,Fe-hydrogenase III large subunit/Ni,Fe-hydrogenase III component G